MIQYLAKFIHNPSHEDAPLRASVKADIVFEWTPEAEKSFTRLKQLCTKPPVLTYYEVKKAVEIECKAELWLTPPEP